MTEAIKSVDGVETCEIDYAAKTATVTGMNMDEAALVTALEAASYGGSVRD